MELLALPPEMVCDILSRITDTKDILSIFNTGNDYLISLASDCIETILTGDPLPFEILLQLRNLKEVEIPIKVTIEEALEIAALPKIELANLDFSEVEINNLKDLLDLVILFVKEYTKYNRDFTGKTFRFIFENIKIIIDAGNVPLIRWRGALKEGFLILMSQLIEFLSEYDSYIPLVVLKLEWLGFATLHDNLLIDFLLNLPKFNTVDPDRFDTRERNLINALKGKITKIRVPGDLIILTDILRFFEPSDSIKEFTVSITVEQLPILFQKFPNVEVIHILGFTKQIDEIGRFLNYGPPISYKTLLEIAKIPQLKTIFISTPYPALVPKNRKFKTFPLKR